MSDVFGPLPVKVDPTLPDGEIHIQNGEETIVVKIGEESVKKPPTMQEQISRIKEIKEIGKEIEEIKKETLNLAITNMKRREDDEAAIRRLVRVIDTADSMEGDEHWSEAWNACVEHGDFERGRKES